MAAKRSYDIITEGMLLAGRDDVRLRAQVWLQTWLDSVAGSWPWPQLCKEVQVPVASGSTYVDLGNGSGGITNRILRPLDNCWIYKSDYTNRGRVAINNFLSEPGLIQNPTLGTGFPMRARLIPQGPAHGKWRLEFQRATDQAYVLHFGYVELPAAYSMTSTTVSDIPWYPNDATMIQLVAAQCAAYDDGPDSPPARAAFELLASMVMNDRIRYGNSLGIHDSMQLDPSIYR